MLSKCANPGCPATFLYLHQGKLFRLDSSMEVSTSAAAPELKKPAHRIEFFWLCDQCALEMTLGYKKGMGIIILPLAKGHGRAASAS